MAWRGPTTHLSLFLNKQSVSKISETSLERRTKKVQYNARSNGTNITNLNFLFNMILNMNKVSNCYET